MERAISCHLKRNSTANTRSDSSFLVPHQSALARHRQCRRHSTCSATATITRTGAIRPTPTASVSRVMQESALTTSRCSSCSITGHQATSWKSTPQLTSGSAKAAPLHSNGARLLTRVLITTKTCRAITNTCSIRARTAIPRRAILNIGEIG